MRYALSFIVIGDRPYERVGRVRFYDNIQDGAIQVTHPLFVFRRAVLGFAGRSTCERPDVHALDKTVLDEVHMLNHLIQQNVTR